VLLKVLLGVAVDSSGLCFRCARQLLLLLPLLLQDRRPVAPLHSFHLLLLLLVVML
jgi:hypothetical protein